MIIACQLSFTSACVLTLLTYYLSIMYCEKSISQYYDILLYLNFALLVNQFDPYQTLLKTITGLPNNLLTITYMLVETI